MNRIDSASRQSAYVLLQIRFVDRQYLGDVHHTGFRQVALAPFERDVSRRFRPIHVGSEEADHRAGNSRLIEEIAP